MDEKIELIGLNKEELAAELTAIGEKPFRVKQLWQWLYFHGATDFEQMSNLSKDLRNKLASRFTISRPKIITAQLSTDHTRKWLLEFADGQRVEMVYIPEEDRGAVCISTQVGCAAGCTFCHTGSQKLTRNLTAGEIVGQFMVARDACGEWPTRTDETRLLSNIVVMGMGEPLHNVDNVFKALKILSDGEGIAISKRKITLSTSGIAPKIPLVASELGVRLAISLHAPNDEKRSRIMPINSHYPLDELMKACQEYQCLTKRQPITFEYLLLKDINDGKEDVRELIALMKKYNISAKFNLIPFNPWPGCSYQPSSNNRAHEFARALENAGYSAPIRVARGQDILAACGQLKSKHLENNTPPI